MEEFKPTQALLNQVSGAIGADTASLGGGLCIAPIKVDFDQSPDLELDPDTDLSDFTGSTPKTMAAATRPDGFDPGNLDRIITIQPPTGGPRWETTDTANLPQSVFGFAMYLGADTSGQLQGTLKLDAPIELTMADEVVQCPNLNFRLLRGALG